MIVGHGIDLQELGQVERAFQKNPRFAEKVLTEAELAILQKLKGQRQLQFLAGRWSAKEAFSKAMGTGIGQLRFHDLEILPDRLGAPCFTRHPFTGRVWVSISHSGNFVQASVILEEEDD